MTLPRARRGAPIAILACLVAAACWPASAAAAQASVREVADLARAAQDDPAALERLRSIDRVDGRPVALRASLQGSAAQVRERLRALAQDGRGGPPSAGARTAREVAREVLSDRRYRAAPLPRPLQGVLRRLGDALAPIGRALEDAFHWVSRRLPGGSITLWGLLAGAVLAAVAVLVLRTAASRQATAATGGASGRGGERLSAAKLRQQADAAERRGDLDEALRLRFRAGLVELDSHELIDLRPALTNREILGAVPSPTLGGLVAGFESVAYGGRRAGAEDVRSAREGWPRVLDEAGRR